MRIETRILKGDDLASTLVDFARYNNITQIYLTRPNESKWPSLFSRSLLMQIVGLARDMQIVIVSEREAGTD
jgi:K+-sensing histidine kinase KdpD